MNIKDTEKKIVKPSQEKVWYKHYAPEAIEQLKEKMPEQTLWKYISTAIKADNDQHDAIRWTMAPTTAGQRAVGAESSCYRLYASGSCL